ncbi:hypothetical protein KIPB_013600, partial [Kipferlia bialata]|eukprot:g13600.t1
MKGKTPVQAITDAVLDLDTALSVREDARLCGCTACISLIVRPSASSLVKIPEEDAEVMGDCGMLYVA